MAREPRLATNQRTLLRALLVRLPSFGILLGLVVHHPRPPRPTGPRVSLLSDRECERCVRLRTSRYANTSLRTYVQAGLAHPARFSNFRSRRGGGGGENRGRENFHPGWWTVGLDSTEGNLYVKRFRVFPRSSRYQFLRIDLRVVVGR